MYVFVKNIVLFVPNTTTHPSTASVQTSYFISSTQYL